MGTIGVMDVVSKPHLMLQKKTEDIDVLWID